MNTDQSDDIFAEEHSSDEASFAGPNGEQTREGQDDLMRRMTLQLGDDPSASRYHLRQEQRIQAGIFLAVVAVLALVVLCVVLIL